MTDELEKKFLRDPFYDALKRHLIEATGLTYFQDKDADLCQRLRKRFDVLGIEDCRTYLAYLTGDVNSQREFDALVVELTIGETYFLRHVEQFDALRTDILPDLIARNQLSRRLRIWCAGCSIGAEPYSLSILMAEQFSAELAGWDVKIIGTDINREFLARADKGVFDEWAFRTTEPEFRRRHFVPQGKSWVLKPALRERVEFHWHNLMNFPFSTSFAGWGEIDLIICRNVMIYFDTATIEKVIPSFEQALREGGWLVIGHAEQPHGAKELMLMQFPHATAYRKSSSAPSLPLPSFQFTAPLLPPLPVPSTFVLPMAASLPHNIVSPAPSVAAISTASEHAISYLRKLANAGQFELALAEAKRISKFGGEQAIASFYEGLIYSQMGRRHEAGRSFRQALATEPQFVMARYHLGLLFQRTGDLPRAAREFREALAVLGSLKENDPLPEGDEVTVGELRQDISKRLEAA